MVNKNEIKNKSLVEWQELKKEIKAIENKRKKIVSEIDKRYPEPCGVEKYRDGSWQKIRPLDIRLSWLEQVKKEMLYEAYFLDHSKGTEKIGELKTKDGEYWDDKYFYDIRDILGKWYKKCMSGVNEFRLGYEGASDNYISKEIGGSGISTSAWGFVGDFVYKIVREISEPKLYFRNYEGGDNGYHGILYKNLYDWRKQKGLVVSKLV